MQKINISVDIENEPKHYTQGDIIKGIAHLCVLEPEVGDDGKPKNKQLPPDAEFDDIKLDLEGMHDEV